MNRRSPRSTRGRSSAALWMALALLSLPAAIRAQTVSVPPNLILPNYDRLPIGQQEGIEAGAFVARTGDAGSNWFNPAGLAKSEKSAVNASANAYEWTSIELEGLGESAGRSRISSIGTLFSAVLGKGPLKSDKWRLGFSIPQPITWQPSSIELAFTEQGGQEAIAYGSEVNFTVMIPGIAAAFAPGGVANGKFRVGAGMGLAMTSLSQSQGASNRVTTPSSASLDLRSFAADGSSWDLRFTGGLQWDATPAIALGARLAAPTFQVTGSSRMNYQKSQAQGPALNDIVFRDNEASFEYKLPGEAALGASWTGKSAQAEIDVHYYASIDSYDMYSSEKAGTYTQVDTLGNVTTSSVTLAPTTNSNRSVVNVAVGGSYLLTTHMRVHAGFASDRSPVPDGPQSTFRQVNLNRFTSGISLSGSNLSGSLGFGFSSGTGTRSGAVTSLDGTPVETRLKVHTANLLFALSYSFSAPQ